MTNNQICAERLLQINHSCDPAREISATSANPLTNRDWRSTQGHHCQKQGIRHETVGTRGSIVECMEANRKQAWRRSSVSRRPAKRLERLTSGPCLVNPRPRGAEAAEVWQYKILGMPPQLSDLPDVPAI